MDHSTTNMRFNARPTHPYPSSDQAVIIAQKDFKSDKMFSLGIKLRDDMLKQLDDFKSS